MNTLDFLSSDIQFPNDSNEPKLSAAPGSKLPESVDWTFHDFYNTVLEKEFTPMENLTEIKYLEPVKDDYLRDWKQPSIFAVQDKQEDQAVVLVLANTIQTPQTNCMTMQQPNHSKKKNNNNNNNNIGAALRGALQLVENDMQHSMHDALKSPMNDHQQNDNYISWKDYFFNTNLYNNNNSKPPSLHGDDLDQDLWDDDEIEYGPPSPAYHSISENPILDSSLPSRISSIMMPNTINSTIDQAILNERPKSVIKVVSSQPPIPTIQVTSTSSSSSSSGSSPSSPSKSESESHQDTILTTPDEHTDTIKATPVEPSQDILSKKSKWSLWKKVKQVTHPLKKSFKLKSTTAMDKNTNNTSKNAFKRLFQH
ncbi:unnamed protein product [Cunninghamella blakesleeana]